MNNYIIICMFFCAKLGVTRYMLFEGNVFRIDVTEINEAHIVTYVFSVYLAYFDRVKGNDTPGLLRYG
jgi:membrane protein CcdC involved in cytochrome C biogenesis